MSLAAGAAALAAVFLVLYKAAQDFAPRGDVVAAMILGSAAFNSATALAQERRLPRLDGTSWKAALALSVGTIVGNVGVAESLGQCEPAVTSVLMQTQVLFVALMARAALGEPITRRFVLGVVVALAGVVLMRAPLAGEAAPRVSLGGVFWALAAAAAFGSMQVITRKVIDRIRPVAVNAVRLWLAAFLLLAMPGRLGSLATMPAAGWGLAFGAAACGPFASRLALMYAVRTIPASQSVLFGLVAPVLAFGLGWAVFGTVPSGRELLGGLVILAGVAIPIHEALVARRA